MWRLPAITGYLRPRGCAQGAGTSHPNPSTTVPGEGLQLGSEAARLWLPFYSSPGATRALSALTNGLTSLSLSALGCLKLLKPQELEPGRKSSSTSRLTAESLPARPGFEVSMSLGLGTSLVGAQGHIFGPTAVWCRWPPAWPSPGSGQPEWTQCRGYTLLSGSH